jgi:hypothetical protein
VEEGWGWGEVRTLGGKIEFDYIGY